MHTTNLRKVGGSVMLAVPPALLDILNLQPGAQVGIAIERGRLIVKPQSRRRYTLGELLAQCNAKVRFKNARRKNARRKNNGRKNAGRTKREQEWLDSRPVGGELI